jgi:hypothetical protein
VIQQKPELRPRGLHRASRGEALVTRETVEDDDVAGAQRGHEASLDPRREAGGIDRPVEDVGRATQSARPLRQRIHLRHADETPPDG